MNKAPKIEWDKFPGTLENPSDFRKGSGDYGVTFAVPVKHVGYIQPLMEKAQRCFAVFIVPAASMEQAEQLLREKNGEPQGVTDGSIPQEVVGCLVSVGAMASVLGIDPRTVQLDAEKGLLVKTGLGQYDALASCGTLRKALKEAETGKNDAYNEERTGVVRENRLRKECERLEKMGKLVNYEELMHALERKNADMKQKMLFLEKSLPPRLAMKPANEQEPIIRKEIRKLLTEFAMGGSEAEKVSPQRTQRKTKKKKK